MNEKFLLNRTALVTGATRGIGFAIARALADAGALVAICGRTQASVDDAVSRLTQGAQRKVLGKVADVRASESVAALFMWFDQKISEQQSGQQNGGPDILVNNAGVGIMKRTADLTPEEWRQTIDTNLSGVFHCSREALSRMKRRGGGSIINIGSLAGKNAFTGGAAYNASKFGLNGFTEAMLLDHRHDNVRVAHIMPGSVDTDFSSDKTSSDETSSEKTSTAKPSSESARSNTSAEPGVVKTETDWPGNEWKIAPEDIGEIVLMMLRMPERTLVSRVEVRPAKPRN
jgi:3-oxoacyl-[acyl-carrier protein] reductase